jgi:hypothetical protein
MEKQSKPVLVAFLPPLGGLPKTKEFFGYHRSLINTGDIVYCYATALLAAGRNHMAWNFSADAQVVNEAFSRVVWSIPCRITDDSFEGDHFPYETATKFIEELKIPFVSVTESIQSRNYEYDSQLHKRLPAKVVHYLKAIGEKSAVVGARGHYSAEVLSRLGITNVQAIGCPSLYINGPCLRPELLKKRSFKEITRIAVAYSNYQMSSNSRISDILKLAAANDYFYVEQTANIVFKMLYYPESIQESDVQKAIKLYGGRGGLESIRIIYQRKRLRYFTNYANWSSFFTGIEFAFGARMHGLTPAVHNGVPALFVAHDCRLREMCEFFSLPFVAEKDMTLEPRVLYGMAEYDKASATYPRLYRQFLAFLTKNGISPNCDEALQPIPDVDAGPADSVEQELNPIYSDNVSQRLKN